MTGEIDLIHDGEGLAILGEPATVERFLESHDFLPNPQSICGESLKSVLETGSMVAEVLAEISACSGRYVRLTKESAERVKEFGLMPTKIKGVSHAMIGNPGSINKWIQIENGPMSLLANPAFLSGAAGIMAQLARQQEAKELRRLLETIDGKLDDVRRRQRDEILAKMDRADSLIGEAATIREHGGDCETNWDKVKTEAGTIAEVQANALRALEVLAGKLDGKINVPDLEELIRNIESEAGVWLAVLARCFQLRDECAVLELEHVLHAAPSKLDGHRLGLEKALRERCEDIVGKTGRLMSRLDEVGGVARENVLLHARKARAVVESVNRIGSDVDDLHRPLGIEAVREPLQELRWPEAVRDLEQWKKAGVELAPKAAAGVGVAALLVSKGKQILHLVAKVGRNIK